MGGRLMQGEKINERVLDGGLEGNKKNGIEEKRKNG